MKLYKFYKDGCPPCYSLSRLLNKVKIPEEIEIVPSNVSKEENKTFAKQNEINQVPALMFENGSKLIGVPTEQTLIDFLIGGTSEISHRTRI